MKNIELDKIFRMGARMSLKTLSELPLKDLKKKEIIKLVFWLSNLNAMDLQDFLYETKLVWITPEREFILKEQVNVSETRKG